MIRNDKQYQVTKSRLASFKESLARIESMNIDSLEKELHVGTINSQIADFEEELMAYEQLKEGKLIFQTSSPFSDWHMVLIKARIAKGCTQAALAEKLGLKEQAIQRYEITDYSGASLARIGEVTSALDIDIPPIKIRIGEVKVPEDVDPEEFQIAFHKLKSRGIVNF